MREILANLRQAFDLKQKHIDILEFVLQKSASATEISRATDIPQGRIYNFLNELIDYGLLEKTSKKPFLYSTKNFDSKVIDFMKRKFDNMVNNQLKIMEIMEKKTQSLQEIDIIHSGEEFSFRTVQLLKECKEIKIVIRHGSFPFSLYPFKINHFLKVRAYISKRRQTLAQTTMEMAMMIYKSHNDALLAGKSIHIIFEKNAWDNHVNLIKKGFGIKFTENWLHDIKNMISTYKLKCYVADEILPMNLMINEKRVFLSLIHHGITTGVSIYNSKVVELYDDLFDGMVYRSKPLSEFLGD